jgi:UDP-N-acetyl-D-glucosamine dehydrogenase
LAAAKAGLRVVGFDIDPTKPARLARGESHLRHVPAGEVRATVESGRFHPTSDFDGLGKPDVLLICVPTPLNNHLEPDLSFIVSTGEAIAKRLRRGQLVVLESTTYPGTTDEVLRPILEKSGLDCGKDFLLAFSPEREDPGNSRFSTSNIPKVVGADDPMSLEAALGFYGSFVSHTVKIGSTRTAEAVKLTENVFRSVNIALVNELKIIFDAMGIDVWEVIDGAKTKPFGYMPFYPGPGLGGHCIPIDPFYLAWKAREYGITTHFIELAGEINATMPIYVVNRLAHALDMRFKKGLNGSRILILGVAYKKNVDDMRECPALRIIELLEERGSETAFHDPFVSVIPPTREHAEFAGRKSLPWSANLGAAWDATLIVTDHDGVDYAALAEASPLVVDTRNACRKAGVNRANVILA